MVDALRKEIKRLFAEEKVDIMIGWGKGSMALSSTPVFVHKAEDAECLIFDETCQNNLAVYLSKDKWKMVIVG
jgi:formate dehydrogenase subunit beta